MRTTKQLMLGVLGVVAVAALAAVLLIWPNYSEARGVRAQVRELEGRLAGLGDRAQAVLRLAHDVEAARKHVRNDLKVIPEGADVAGLIRKLSYPIDGVTVSDQTFTAGSPADAIVAGTGAGSATSATGGATGAPPQAMPVTAEMSATFESVLALIDNAESMNRLIRVASVRVMCKREDQKTDVPLLKASIGLEVIYDAAGSMPPASDGAAKEDR